MYLRTAIFLQRPWGALRPPPPVRAQRCCAPVWLRAVGL